MIGIFNFLIFIVLAIIFVVVFIFIAILGKVQSFIRQIRGNQNSESTGSYRYGSTFTSSSQSSSSSSAESVSGGTSQKKKIIPADEGEYVEFEEIK